MGNVDTKKEIEQQYQIINVQPTGNTLLKSKINQKQYLMRVVSSSNKVDIGRIKSLLQCRALLKNNHLFSLVQIKQKQKENMCSRHHNLFLVLEYSSKSIAQDVIQRSANNQKNHFNQSQLWSIIYSCCNALNTLYSNGGTHESISSKNIYINNDGYIKIADPLLFGLQKNYIQILNNKQKMIDIKSKEQINLHLSPEIVTYLDQQNFQYYDREKADIFILGMIIVDLALLKYNDLFYSKEQLRYLEIIPQLMKEINQRYSNKLIDLLGKMLRIQPNERLSIYEVISIIQKQNNSCQQSILTETLKRNSPDKSRFQENIQETANKIIKNAIKPQNKVLQNQIVFKEQKLAEEYDRKKKTQPLIPSVQHPNNTMNHYETSLSIKEGYSQLNNHNFDGRIFVSTNQTHQSNLNSNNGLYSTIKNSQPFYNQKNYFNDIKISKNTNPNILYENSRSIKSLKVSENHDSQQEIQKNKKISTEKKFNKNHPNQEVIDNHFINIRTINNLNKINYSNQNQSQSQPQQISLKQPTKISYNKIQDHLIMNQFSPNQIKRQSLTQQLNTSYEKRFSSPNKPTIVMKFLNNDNIDNKSILPSLNSQKIMSNNTNQLISPSNNHKRTFSGFSALNISANTPQNDSNNINQNSIKNGRQSITNMKNINLINQSINITKNQIKQSPIINDFNQIYINDNAFKKTNIQNENKDQNMQAQNSIKVQQNRNSLNIKKLSFVPLQNHQYHNEIAKTQKPQNKVIFTHEIPQVYNILKNNTKTPTNSQFFSHQQKKIILNNNHASTPHYQENVGSINRFKNFANYPRQTISQFGESHTSIYSPNYKQKNQEGSIKKDNQKPGIRETISHEFNEESKIPIKKQSSIKLFAPKTNIDRENINQSSSNQQHLVTFKKISNKSLPSDQISIKTETYLTHHPIGINNPKQYVANQSMANRKLQYVVDDNDEKGRYEGYKFENKKNGQGMLYFKQGGYYNGEWRDDKMQGYGKLYYQNGNIAYEGYWRNDEFSGKGRVYNSDPTPFQHQFDYNDFSDLQNKWIYYDGEFKNDEKNGKGYIKLANGQMFQGMFDHDMIEGNGIFYKSSGQIVVGYWINNRLFLNQSFSYDSKKSI